MTAKARGARKTATTEARLICEGRSGRSAMPLRSAERFATLRQAAGIMKDKKSKRIGGRISPKLVRLAKQKTGNRSDSDLIEAGLLTMATDDAFGFWLVAQAGRLDGDLDLGL
jgi:hypothetical protein